MFESLFKHPRAGSPAGGSSGGSPATVAESLFRSGHGSRNACSAMLGKFSLSLAESRLCLAEPSPGKRSKGRPIAGPAIRSNGTVLRK